MKIWNKWNTCFLITGIASIILGFFPKDMNIQLFCVVAGLFCMYVSFEEEFE